MFRPPYDGVRGLDAYGQTWPPFFEWRAGGALFEIESIDITAGAEVAFAFALLRCGSQRELAENPLLRLRLTVGLLKKQGRWVVTYEHHSFPDVSTAGADASAVTIA
jgi:ketosteroid isomerase-like protein